MEDIDSALVTRKATVYNLWINTATDNKSKIFNKLKKKKKKRK